MRPTTLRQQAYQLLRKRLASGDLSAGTQLSEPNLAKQFGMSRTPVREALRQLENEGLLDYAPRFGAVVRVLERDELGEMYAVREALESYAVAEAAQKIGASDLEKLASTFQQMCETADTFRESGNDVLDGSELKAFIQADLTFHEIIIAAAGNRYMSRILGDTRLLVRVFTATFWQYNAEKLTEAIQFHRQLLAAMQNRDSESAQLASIEAMRVARDNALRAWDQQRED
ncbi:MAG: GntR family transcriptional regulator [Fuerstiella sp.]|nr:GntR family transcriptional regulator [Fuerstiella sp.]MCP4857512.1 GntR family transcriptional regulator [Fuerstiella sp.]